MVLSSARPLKSPKGLVSLAVRIGSNKTLVQGPGGNVSIKEHDGIWVKRSGTWLEKAKASEIFCFLPKQRVSGRHEYQLAGELQVSIETPFHTLIPFKCVLHVHSMGSLTWGLREPTDTTYEVMKKLGLHFAPYIKPGIAIADYIRENPTILKSKGIVLANHGLITWSRTTRGGFRKLMKLEESLLNEAMAVKRNSSDRNTRVRKYERVPLTPDHAVFFEENRPNQVWVTEMNAVLVNALNLIPRDQSVCYLKPEDIVELTTWDAEKIRRALNE